MIPRDDRLTVSQATLLVVDVQARLLPHIGDHETLVAQCVRAVRCAAALGVPILVSEQYTRGLGPTHSEILSAAGAAARVEKISFSVCGDEAALAALRIDQRPQVLLVGVETHVCVQQTALDLLAAGARPCVLADAVGSRRSTDRGVALERMRSAGVVITTVESAVYELMREAGTTEFKRVLEYVR